MTEEFSDILLHTLGKLGSNEWHNEVIRRIGYEVLGEDFKFNEKIYNNFFDRIQSVPEKAEKFKKAIKFYYFWCKRPSVREKERCQEPFYE